MIPHRPTRPPQSLHELIMTSCALAVHNKVADSLHGSQADLACHLDRENSHPQLPAPSPSLPPPATPPPPPSDPASLLALHQHQHHNSHAHAGPVHVYDWLADGGEHMHVVALCRFYLVDLLCHEVHDNDAAGERDDSWFLT